MCVELEFWGWKVNFYNRLWLRQSSFFKIFGIECVRDEARLLVTLEPVRTDFSLLIQININDTKYFGHFNKEGFSSKSQKYSIHPNKQPWSFNNEYKLLLFLRKLVDKWYFVVNLFLTMIPFVIS